MTNSSADVLSIFGIILVCLVIVGDIVLSVFKSEREGTTWSELLRESVGITTIIPWALGVWIGRWFPILQKPPLPWQYSLIILLVLSIIFVVLGDVLMIKMRRPLISPCIFVTLGLVVGGIFIPLSQMY